MRGLEFVLALLCFACAVVLPLMAKSGRLWGAIGFLSLAFLLLWRATVESLPRASEVLFSIGALLLFSQLVRLVLTGYRKSVSGAR